MASVFKVSCVFLGLVLFSSATLAKSVKTTENEVDGRIRTSEDLVSSVMSDCSSMYCVKDKVLNYLDQLLGLSEDDSRSFQADNIDEAIYDRVSRLFKTQQFTAVLPGNTVVSYNPYTGLNLDMPTDPTDDENTAQARGLLKKKLFLPILLLFKLKMKLLMPILVALIGLKSLKALILSKLAILMVVGFIGYQLYAAKNGMMSMPMMMSPADPPSAYGPPMDSTTPASSYQPSWEASAGGPYSRIWSGSSDSASSGSNIAYSAYYPVSSSSSSSGSSNSPVYRSQ